MKNDLLRRRVQSFAPASTDSWYRIQNATDDEAKIYIYDVISWYGITADQFVRDLDKITASTIHLHINSPGGDVFDGMAIYTALKNHAATVIVHVDGLAASIASVIAMAGEEIRMGEGSFVMIHDPWMLAIGTANDLRDGADLLDKIAGSIADVYVRRTGLDRDEVIEMMAAETWMDAKEAEEKGFADAAEEAEEDADAAASFDLSAFEHVPERLAAQSGKRDKTPRTPTVREAEKALRDAGFSRKAAAAMVAGGYKAASDARDEPDGSQSDAIDPNAVAQLEETIALARLSISLRPARN